MSRPALPTSPILGGASPLPGPDDRAGSRIRNLRTMGGMAALAAVLFLAPGLFGSVALGPLMVSGGVLALGLMITPAPLQANNQSPVTHLIALGFVMAILIGVAQIGLSDVSGSAANLMTEAQLRLAPQGMPKTINPGRTAQALGQPLVLLLAFLLGARLGTEADRVRMIVVLLAATALFWAVIGIGQFVISPQSLLWTTKYAYRDSLTGPFVNRNTAAAYFGLGLLCLLAAGREPLRLLFSPRRARNSRVKGQRLAILLLLGGGALLVLAIILTRSRAGIVLSLAMAGALAAGLVFWHRIKAALILYPHESRVAVAGAIVGLFGLLLIAVDQVGQRGISDGGRMAVYRASLELLEMRPVWGTGLGTFADAFPFVRPASLSAHGIWDRAHNTGLELAVEIGAPAAALIIALALAALFKLARGVRARQRNHSLPGVGLAAGLLAVLHSAVDFSLQIPGFAVPFFILLGATLAQARPTPRQVIAMAQTA